ncbi:MAG: DUF4837 family protein [Longimicrobiales bacterium]|nr:DUF4837 family protein [Longimicrobiales bacterium]
MKRITMRTSLFAALATCALAVGACDQSRAYGDANTVIVAATPEIWNAVQDSVQAILEPEIYTVRQERTFDLTYQNPAEEAWSRMQLFRQELAIGSEEDPWVAQALEEYDGDEPLSPPQILQVQDVWAQNQLVTVLLLRPGGGAEEVLGLLPELHELMDEQYREYARSRMFISGRDTALARHLMQEAGFTLEVANVYDTIFQDSVYIFRNDNPSPSELIRQVSVAWQSPIPDTDLSVDSLLAWRRNLAEVYYPYPQVNDTTTLQAQEGTYRGMPVTEIQAVWSNPPQDAFPAGGPFILRAVECPPDDRLYLLDAWLYAPGQDKYEYMIQLETILSSFRCTTGG